MERSVRDLKREKEALKELGMDTDEINARISRKKREYDEFCKMCGVNPKPSRLRYECGTADLKKTEAWKSHEIIVNMAKSGIMKRETLSRARNIKTVDDLLEVSSSRVIGMEKINDIQSYFESAYGIKVEGFENKDLFDVKATLAGYDDILAELPETARKIKYIKYNSHLKDYGKINTKGLSEVGPLGLRDYGTGVHEASHAYDLAMSRFGTHSFAEEIVEQARKNLKLRKNTKEYRSLLMQITASYKDIDNACEVFAYAIETAKCGIDNRLATEIYRLMKESKE